MLCDIEQTQTEETLRGLFFGCTLTNGCDNMNMN